MAYERFDPIGAQRIDLAAGIIASAVANTTRSKQSDRVYTAEDFMPEWSRAPKRQQTGAEQLAIINQIAAMGGVIDLRHLRKKKKE